MQLPAPANHRDDPQETLLVILERAAAEGVEVGARLRQADCVAAVCEIAERTARRAGMPPWVDPRDAAQDALCRIYAAQIDPRREPRQQMLYLLTLIRGAVLDFERRSGDRIRSQRARRDLPPSRFDRMVAASVDLPVRSSEDAALDALDSLGVAAAVDAATTAHPECSVCARVAKALAIREDPVPAVGSVYLHLHLLAELWPLRAEPANASAVR